MVGNSPSRKKQTKSYGERKRKQKTKITFKSTLVTYYGGRG
jgi:hypothetical protein